MFDSFRLLSSEQKHAVTNWTPTRGIYATINMYDIFSLLSVVNSIRLHSNLFFVCVWLQIGENQSRVFVAMHQNAKEKVVHEKWISFLVVYE